MSIEYLYFYLFIVYKIYNNFLILVKIYYFYYNINNIFLINKDLLFKYIYMFNRDLFEIHVHMN